MNVPDARPTPSTDAVHAYRVPARRPRSTPPSAVTSPPRVVERRDRDLAGAVGAPAQLRPVLRHAQEVRARA